MKLNITTSGNLCLKHINLSNNNLAMYGTDMTGVTSLCDALKDMPTLRHIDLSGNHLSFGRGIEYNLPEEGLNCVLNAVKEHGGITSLALSDNFIKLDHKELAKLMAGLTCTDTSSASSAAAILGRGQGSTTLQSLDLSGNDMCSGGAATENDSNERGVAALCTALCENAKAGKSSLTSLDLSRNRLGPHLAERVLNAVACLPGAEDLQISDTGNDKQVAHLNRLDLSDTQLCKGGNMQVRACAVCYVCYVCFVFCVL
jgi:hypothetical protein